MLSYIGTCFNYIDVNILIQLFLTINCKIFTYLKMYFTFTLDCTIICSVRVVTKLFSLHQVIVICFSPQNSPCIQILILG